MKSAISGNAFFDIELIELRNGGKSYTYQTMRELVEIHPENEYYFIIGGEHVKSLPTWDHIEELTRLVTLVAGVHSNQEKKSDYPMLWCDVPDMRITSSEIRTKIRLNQSINYLVPEGEACFMAEYNLYRGLYD